MAQNRKAPKPSRAPWFIIGGAIVIALVAALVVSTGGSDDTTAQTAAVRVTGAPLPKLNDSGVDTAIGKMIPNVAGSRLDGADIDIVADGRPKLIFFLAHWCPHCRAEVPVVTKWLNDKGAPQGVDLYAVSTAVDKARPNYPPSEWLAKEKWPVPTLVDSPESAAGNAYGVGGFPMFVSVKADGTVAARASGELPVAEIEKLLAAARA